MSTSLLPVLHDRGIELIATAIIQRALQDIRDRRLEFHVKSEAREWLKTTGTTWASALDISDENWYKLTQTATGFFYGS